MPFYNELRNPTPDHGQIPSSWGNLPPHVIQYLVDTMYEYPATNPATPADPVAAPEPGGDPISGDDGFDFTAFLEQIAGGSGFGGGDINTDGIWGTPGADQGFQDMITEGMLNPSVGQFQTGLEGSIPDLLSQLLNPQFASDIGGVSSSSIFQTLLNPQLADSVGGVQTSDIASLLASGAGEADWLAAGNPLAERLRYEGTRKAIDAKEIAGNVGSGVGTGADRLANDVLNETEQNIGATLGQLAYASDESARNRDMQGNTVLMNMLNNLTGLQAGGASTMASLLGQQMGLASQGAGGLANILGNLEGQENSLINQNLQQLMAQLYGSSEAAADRMYGLIPDLMDQQNANLGLLGQFGTVFQGMEQGNLDRLYQDWIREQFGNRPEIMALLGTPLPGPGQMAEGQDWANDIAQIIAAMNWGGGGD